jgi:ankyrin repeat protein
MIRVQMYGNGSALVAAIEKGRANIAIFVLENGADPNAEAGSIGNALEAACSRGQTEIVRALLKHGADARFEGTAAGSALLIAAQKGHKDVVGLLLDHGADLDADTGNNRSYPLRAAVVNGHMDCVQLLVERGASVNHRSATQGRALEAAMEIGREDMVRFLLDRGAEDKLVAGLDKMWLPGAVFNIVSKATKWRDVLDTILDRFDYSSQLAGNAFVSVARDGNLELVEFFLRNGVDIEKHGPRALGVASVAGHLHILQRLFAAGVDVQQVVPKRGPAILRAAGHGHAECVKALLEKGASPNIVFGTPRLEDRGITRAVFHSTPLQAACWGLISPGEVRNEEIARVLLEAGADPNVAGARWFHPLNLAAYQGNLVTVRLLLEHGADPSARGSIYGDNALQAAVQSRSIDIVRLLLEHGAKIDGSGALQAACGARHDSGNMELVKLLLDYGADPNDRSEAYACTGYISALSATPGTLFWSALECARKGRNNEIIQLLMDCGAK